MKPLLVTTASTRDIEVNDAIWRMVHARTNASMRQFNDTFEHRTINRSRSYTDAERMLHGIRDSGRTVVLFGDTVHAVFDFVLDGQLPQVLIHPIMIEGCLWRQVPHVLCSWYDNRENQILIEMLFEELFVQQNRRCLSDVTQ